MAGLAGASISSPGPYDNNGNTYYNVGSLHGWSKEKAESYLREYNHYVLQILNIHEAIPGHYTQLIYSNNSAGKNSSRNDSTHQISEPTFPGIIKAIFGNGAMVEGWAVYCEQMMMENSWGNAAPELWLTLYKWRLRECSNVLIDYGIQCLNYSEDDVYKLLKNETFQEDAQIKEKYHRATVSQVQLCSYFTGLNDILALREAYKNKMGSNFSLKDFHEKFLSYGSAPVKYIREVMLK